MAKKAEAKKAGRPRRVLIIGGGIMGTSSAWSLAREGAQVTVLEKAIPGAEASSAAAGILGPEVECDAPGPMLELSRRSRALYPKWVKEIERASGVSTGYAEGGCLDVGFDKAALGREAKKRAFQIDGGHAARVSTNELHELEPGLSSELVGGIFYEGEARITPAALFHATHIAAHRAGVEFVSGVTVRRVVLHDEKRQVRGVLLDDGTLLEADVVIAAAGSWTPQVEGLPLAASDVVPARGQIVELKTPLPLIERLVFGAGVYLIPRADGTLLVGSTLEFVGFKKGVTASAVRDLLAGAIRLVPGLADAELTRTWSNFRPYTHDHLPLLGATSVEGLVIASGHYRTGILLTPVTAEIVTALALGRRPPLDLSAFDPERHPTPRTP